jgi:hypothetical protein
MAMLPSFDEEAKVDPTFALSLEESGGENAIDKTLSR